MVFPPIWREKMASFWACACKLSWTLLSLARVQPLYGAGRKESSGTGLGGVEILLAASCYRNRNKLRQLWVSTGSKASLIYEIIHIWTAEWHRYRGGHGLESRWSPDFFKLLLSNCLSWKIYYSDHSPLSGRLFVFVWTGNILKINGAYRKPYSHDDYVILIDQVFLKYLIQNERLLLLFKIPLASVAWWSL